jgi:alkanesulfonate monooxygenase SsuD/methylene tetrahydromethanopterin reductase-like flavin-dependent oxidoreductase (luciferase family)
VQFLPQSGDPGEDGGRLILGIGAGWNEPEYKAFGLPFDHRVARFDEAMQIIKPLLRDGYVDFEGQYYQARDCEDLLSVAGTVGDGSRQRLC